MVRTLSIAVSAALLLAACGGSGGTATSGGGVGGGSAAIDLTFSGTVSGSTQRLEGRRDCPDLDVAKQAGWVMILNAIVDGKRYELSLIISRYKGPGTLQLPLPADSSSSSVLITFIDHPNNIAYVNSRETTTGSVVVNSDQVSGKIDVKGLQDVGKLGKVSLTATFRCPAR